MNPTHPLRVFIFLACLVGLTASAPAQQPAAPAPATPPTTQPRKVVVPPGFKMLSVNGRNVLCEPVDESWVTTALTKIPATTKPSTQPASMLQKLAAQRDNIIRSLTTDLAMTDMVPVAKAYDTDLTPQLRKLDELRPPLFYMTCTTDRIADIMRNGWQDPHYYYNRAADSVSFSSAGALDTEKPMDDVVFPAVYQATDTPEKKSESLTIIITGIEAQIGASIDARARIVVGSTFANMVNNIAIEPLKLKEDQTWLGVGVANILSFKYTSMITDQPRLQLVQGAIMEHPQNPLKMSAVDLLKPPDLKTVREDAVPAYFDTIRRKSTRAIQYLIEKAGGGDTAIPKALAAVRDKKPADGAATVKVIQDSTTVDLTPALAR